MTIEFEKPRAEDAGKLEPFYSMRPNKTCDSGLLDTYLWAGYYQTKIAVVEEQAVLTLMQSRGEYFSAMPWCREEQLEHYFSVAEQYFNEELHAPFKIYLADEEGVEALGLKENPRYLVREETDLKDYLYSAEELRTLPGKRFHKKKNQLNRFLKSCEGRWEFRMLDCGDKQTVWEFLDRWYQNREAGEAEGEDTLEHEVSGIHEMLQHCFQIRHRIGGIFVDGRLEAFSIGSYNPREKMACITIEKGNSRDYPGIYQAINQQFISHAFPEAEIVNREDDLGLPGLRQAKESYNPIGYARKYMVLQTDFKGYEKELTDQYEEEVEKHAAAHSEN